MCHDCLKILLRILHLKNLKLLVYAKSTLRISYTRLKSKYLELKRKGEIKLKYARISFDGVVHNYKEIIKKY